MTALATEKDHVLDSEELQLLSLLNPGKQNAISVKTLCYLLDMNEPKLRAMVEHLLDDHGISIGTSYNKPFGYYLLTTPEEVRENYDRFVRIGLAHFHRAARIKKTSIEQVFGQIRLGTE
jgi:hypothetical protein